MLIKETTTSEVVEDMLKKYGCFLLEGRIPHIIDGLKNVHRRILSVIVDYDESHKQKVASITGKVINIHPHSDKSINEVVTELARPYSNTIAFINTKGKVGSYSRPESAAAPRYLDVWCSDFTKDVYFDIHPKAIKTRDTVTDKGKEAQYYIPTIPMALLISTTSIGVGAKAVLVSKNFNNICDLAIEYIKRRMDNRMDIKGLEKLLLPDSPVEGFLLNSKELLQAYKQGDYNRRIVNCGTVELDPTCITFRHISMNNNFIKNTETRFRALKREKDPIFKHIGLPESYQDKNTGIMRGELVVPLAKGVSPFDVLDEVKKVVQFEGAITPIPLYVTSESVGVYATPERLLNEWYTARVRGVTVNLKYKQDDLLASYRKAEALLVMKDHTKDIQRIFREVETWKDAIPELSKKYNLTQFQVKYLADIKFKETSKTARQDLVQSMEIKKAKLDEHRDAFRNIHQLLINDILRLKTKYKAYGSRKLKILKYSKAVVFSNGIIQVESVKESKIVRSRFTDTGCMHVDYNPKYLVYKYLWKGTTLSTNFDRDFPKEYPVTTQVFRSKRAKYAVSLSEGKLKKSKIIDGYLDDVTLVDDKIIVLRESGRFSEIDYSDINARRKDSIIGVCSEYTDGPMLIIYMCTKDKNMLHIRKCSMSTKLVFALMSNPEVLYFGPIDKVDTLNVPKKFLSRCKKSNLVVSEELLGGKMSADINIKKIAQF